VAKILVVEDDAVHVRVYVETFAERPMRVHVSATRSTIPTCGRVVLLRRPRSPH